MLLLYKYSSVFIYLTYLSLSSLANPNPSILHSTLYTFYPSGSRASSCGGSDEGKADLAEAEKAEKLRLQKAKEVEEMMEEAKQVCAETVEGRGVASF